MNLKTLFPAISEYLRRNTKPVVVAKKNSSKDKKSIGPTRPGATHKTGKMFRSRQIMPMSPAQYRRSRIYSQKKKVA